MVRFLFRGRRGLATLLALVAVLVFCALGTWQLNRLNQRLALIEQIKARMDTPVVPLATASIVPAELDYRPVRVSGTFDPSQEFLLRNRSLDGSTGYHVVTPLRISGSDKAVLVDRGWIPYTQATPELRGQFAPPPGEVTVEGYARMSQEQPRGPREAPIAAGSNRRDAWFQVNIPQLQGQISYSLVPIFVEQQGQEDPSALPYRGTTALPDAGNHLAYAIQWFSFAITGLGGYLAISYQQYQRERDGVDTAEDSTVTYQGV